MTIYISSDKYRTSRWSSFCFLKNGSSMRYHICFRVSQCFCSLIFLWRGYKSQRINPFLSIRWKLIQIIPTQQPNRVLIHKLPDVQLIIPEEVVMQPRLFIVILVLQSERPMRVLIDTLILFQMTPAGIVAELQEVAVLIGHLSWDADLVAVEVVRLLSVFSVFVDVVLIGETAYVPHIPYISTEGFMLIIKCFE